MDNLTISLDAGAIEILDNGGRWLANCYDRVNHVLELPFFCSTGKVVGMKIHSTLQDSYKNEQMVKFIHRFTNITDLCIEGMIMNSLHDYKFLDNLSKLLPAKISLRSIVVSWVHSCFRCFETFSCQHKFLTHLVNAVENISCRFLSLYITDLDFRSFEFLIKELSVIMKNYWIEHTDVFTVPFHFRPWQKGKFVTFSLCKKPSELEFSSIVENLLIRDVCKLVFSYID